jgi:hypothetical protein
MSATQRVVAKPIGWKGKKGDRYWHKDTALGVHTMCTSCGHRERGWGGDESRKHHRDDCPRIAGPRAEWKGYVDVAGQAHVHRLDVPTKGAHLTRAEALRALDVELSEQAARVAQQRADVAKMLEEEMSP